MIYSKKLGNLLFGKHTLGTKDGLSVQENLNHPDGTRIEWAGNDGLIFTFYRRILKLEKEVRELKLPKKNHK